nr:hypothetical protein HK105_006984 [Polyrhizophydium stewartii]
MDAAIKGENLDRLKLYDGRSGPVQSKGEQSDMEPHELSLPDDATFDRAIPLDSLLRASFAPEKIEHQGVQVRFDDSVVNQIRLQGTQYRDSSRAYVLAFVRD